MRLPFRLLGPRLREDRLLTRGVCLQMARARVTARGLQELDDDVRERNARYVNFFFSPRRYRCKELKECPSMLESIATFKRTT